MSVTIAELWDNVCRTFKLYNSQKRIDPRVVKIG